MRISRLFKFLETGEVPESTALDEAISEMERHDRKYHGGRFDASAMTCRLREGGSVRDSDDSGMRFSIPHVFTGSSASYEKPSLVHVGEGEGSQVYGWGLYGSDQRGVAEMYADNAVNYDAWKGGRKLDLVFPDNLLEAQTAKALIYFKGDVDAAIADFKRRNRGQAIVKELEDHGSEYKVTKNKHVYEQTFFTNRAPGDESHLLSWYDPVSKVNLERIVKALNADSSLNNEYSRTLLKKAKTAFLANLSNRIGEKGIEEATGSDVYKSLSELYKANRERSASEFLARAGIDGIKYPVDSYGSKTIKNGDEAGWNYVSFRDDNIRVDRKWVDGKEVATVGSMVKALKDWVPGIEVEEVDSFELAENRSDKVLRAQLLADDTRSMPDKLNSLVGFADEHTRRGIATYSPENTDIVPHSDTVRQPTKVRLMISPSGRVAGCYDRKTGRVSLVKGVATPATVAHEISWHATFHWAEKNHPELHKTLMQYAKEAPSGIKQSVRERYDGMNLSPEALLDEIGAERFTREDISPLLDGVAKKQAEGWFDNVTDAQNEVRAAFSENTMKRLKDASLTSEEIDRIASLPPKEAVEALVTEMLKGRILANKPSAVRSGNHRTISLE